MAQFMGLFYIQILGELSMDLKQVQQATALLWKIKMQDKIQNLPIPTLVGDTGIGKSSIMKNIFRNAPKVKNEEGKVGKANYLHSLFLAQMEVGDLIGMPDKEYTEKVVNGQLKRAGKTVWLAPDWFPEANSKGILLFDELGDSDPQTRKAVMPLLLTGELHSHILPKDVLLMCAMNPIGGNFGGVGFTKQFQNRLMFWKVKPSIDEWLAYAEPLLPKYALAMVAEQPNLFEDRNDSNAGWESSTAYNGIPSRRSITVATDILQEMTDTDIKDFGDELLTSIVGTAAAGTLLTYRAMKINEVLNVDDLFKKPVETMAKIDTWLNNEEIAKVSAFTRLVKAFLSNTKSVDEYDVKTLGKFLYILPSDMIGGMMFFIRQQLPYHFSLLTELAKETKIFAKLQEVMSKESN